MDQEEYQQRQDNVEEKKERIRRNVNKFKLLSILTNIYK